MPGDVLLHRGSVADVPFVRSLLDSLRPDVVLHFAAGIQVGESMRAPLKYLEGNVAGTLGLLRAMVASGVKRLVFSSSASVYAPGSEPLTEEAPTRPTSPYGESKLYLERALTWVCAAHGMQAVSLRYFNAAGAVEGRRENHRPETHLVPRVLEVAAGRAPVLDLFGADYATPDGSCIRDYVHVGDVADAHVRVLTEPREGHRIYNVGSGRGHSVREVVAAAEKVTGRKVPLHVAPRRSGDPERLVADASRLQRETGWTAGRSGLERILSDAWEALKIRIQT